MKTKTHDILSIVALGLLGVCLLCGLAKMAMKGPRAKQTCNQICSLSLFAAVVLLGVSQLITEEGYSGTCRAFTLDTDQGVDLNDCLDDAHGGNDKGENCFVQNGQHLGSNACNKHWTWSLIGESRVGLCQSVPSLCTPGGPLGQECSDDSNCPEGHQCFNNENDKVCNPGGGHDPFQCSQGKTVGTNNMCN